MGEGRPVDGRDGAKAILYTGGERSHTCSKRRKRESERERERERSNADRDHHNNHAEYNVRGMSMRCVYSSSARWERDPPLNLATRNDEMRLPPKPRSDCTPTSRQQQSNLVNKIESDNHDKTKRARISPQDTPVQEQQNSREKTACTRTASMRSKSPVLCCGVSALESSKPIDDTSSSSAQLQYAAP